MAWYKVVCNHGPGHQSTHTWYIEADTRADAVAQSEYDVDNGRWDWPIWKVTKVRKFKRPELERLIEKEASSLKYAEEEVKNHKRKIRALKTMRNGKGVKPEAVRSVRCTKAKKEHAGMYPTSRCFIRKGEPGKKGWPFLRLFKGMCLDCPHAEVKMKKGKTRVH